MKLTRSFILAALCLLTSAAAGVVEALRATKTTPQAGPPDEPKKGQAFRIPFQIDKSVLTSLHGSFHVRKPISHELAGRSDDDTPFSFAYENSTDPAGLSWSLPSFGNADLAKTDNEVVTVGNSVFHAVVKVGLLNPQPVRMVMRTGTHDSWVIGPNAVRVRADERIPIGTEHQIYDPQMSQTKTTAGAACTVDNEEVSIQGTLFVDWLELGNQNSFVQAGNANLCVANILSPAPHSNLQADGVLALAPPSNIAGSTGLSFLQTLLNGEDLLEAVFGLRLDFEGGESMLNLGASDILSYQAHSIVPLAVYPMAKGLPPMWAVRLDRIFIGETNFFRGAEPAYFESGSTFIELPVDITDSLLSVESVPGVVRYTYPGSGLVQYSVPCVTQRQIGFELHGKKLNINLQDLNVMPLRSQLSSCIAGIIGVPRPAKFIIGQAFLKNFYTIFKFPSDREPTIELATLTGVYGEHSGA